MSSFGGMSQFRAGYWLGVRSFLLNERRDVAKRLEVINAEIERIGVVRVQYHREINQSTGEITVTEHRTGFTVSEGSALEKLIRAYIAAGGNPFDISHFFMPDQTEFIEIGDKEVLADNYPNGGVVAPENANYNDPVGTYHSYPGGFPKLKKYIGNRFGRRENPSSNTDAVVDMLSKARSWCNQEIKEKRQDLEHRIIKLADLREQLEKERDEVLMQAHGGTLAAMPEFNTERYVDSLRLQNITSTFDQKFYDSDLDGTIQSHKANAGKIAQTDSFYEDVSEEVYLTLMS